MKIGDEIRLRCYKADYRVKITHIDRKSLMGDYNTIADYRKDGLCFHCGTFNFDSIQSFRVLKSATPS